MQIKMIYQSLALKIHHSEGPRKPGWIEYAQNLANSDLRSCHKTRPYLLVANTWSNSSVRHIHLSYSRIHAHIYIYDYTHRAKVKRH